MNVRRYVAGAAIAVSVLVPAAVAEAQDEASPPTTIEVTTDVDDDDDDGGNVGLWGLLGLLGLLGLAGLAGRKRDDDTHRYSGTVAADTTPRGSTSSNP